MSRQELVQANRVKYRGKRPQAHGSRAQHEQGTSGNGPVKAGDTLILKMWENTDIRAIATYFLTL